ncbi:hypothetical protein BOX15_Mlig004867g1 [Macrostomum lignano]|nr:hypothetical protein BOX15_Mlig004867g1 [Macrostomum lignano]
MEQNRQLQERLRRSDEDRRARTESVAASSPQHHRQPHHHHQQQHQQPYYAKYLRAEKHRRDLVYQKEYLRLLLSRYSQSEDSSVDESMFDGAAHRQLRCQLQQQQQQRPRRRCWRLRSAVYAVMAAWRLRMLTRRWRRAVGVTASVDV